MQKKWEQKCNFYGKRRMKGEKGRERCRMNDEKWKGNDAE